MVAILAALAAAASTASAGVGRDWVVFTVWSGLPVPVGRTLGDLGRCGGVWAVRTDGTDLHRLVAGFEPSKPAWGEPLKAVASPDGGSVAILRAREGRGERLRLDVLDVATGRIRTVATTPLVLPLGVWWTPDGRGLLYLTGDESRTSLVHADLVARTKRVLVAGGFVLDVSVAPDGTRLAAQVYGNDSSSVRIVSLAGGATYQLAANAIAPSWSPDGARVAYLRPDVDESTYELHVIAPDGNGDQTLATGILGAPGQLRWSPDSSEVIGLRLPTRARYPGETNGAGVPTAYALAGGQRTLVGAPALPVGFADDGTTFVSIREQLLRGRDGFAESIWTIRVANVGAPGQRIVGVEDEQDVNVGGYPTILARDAKPLGPGPAPTRCAATLVRVKNA